MHARDRLLDGQLVVLELAGLLGGAVQAVRWRVSDSGEVHHVLLVLGHALRTQGLVVTHAKSIDRLLVFSADCVLNGIQGLSHLVGHHLRRALAGQIVTHFYLIARLVIDRGK